MVRPPSALGKSTLGTAACCGLGLPDIACALRAEPGFWWVVTGWPAGQPMEGSGSLRMVVVVQRHGARAPSGKGKSCLRNDLSWPMRSKFWAGLAGTLVSAHDIPARSTACLMGAVRSPKRRTDPRACSVRRRSGWSSELPH